LRSPWLHCRRCEADYPLGPMLFGCPACGDAGGGGLLEVRYDLEQLGAAARATLRAGGPSGRMWDYRAVLPVADPANEVSIGEGGTPLIELRDPPQPGAPIWLKQENCNPTSSFKDRLNSVVVSTARQWGFTRVVAYTTGNHGVSLAAYAAAAGMRCLILHVFPIRPLARQQLALYGAEVVRLTSEAVLPMIETLVQEHGFYPSWRGAADPGLVRLAQPYTPEGTKTIAFEVYRQLGGRTPDVMAHPTAGGDGLAGTWKGFRELQAAGVDARPPRMLACQAETAGSLARARARGQVLAERVELGESIASSILDSRTSDHAALAVQDSGGEAISVTDEEIRDAIRLLARQGLCIEPASCASVAGLLKARRSGMLDRELSAVCVLTGSGLRWPDTFGPTPDERPPVSSLEELRAQVRL